MKEIKKAAEAPFKLTGEQELARRFILDSLKKAGPKTIIVLEGLSGVGKSTVINGLQGEINQTHGLIVNPNYLIYLSKIPDKFLHHSGPLVIDTTPRELALIKARLPQDFEWQHRLMKGMNLEETREYLRKISYGQQTTLIPEQIVEYSMGVPLLIERLTSDATLTEDSAEIIAVEYLRQNFPGTPKDDLQEELPTYLEIQPPIQVIERLTEIDLMQPKHIYQDLGRVLERKKALEKKGIFEESPLFLAPQSVEIYNQMLALSGSDVLVEIDIFVPELTHEEYLKLGEALGFIEKDGSYIWPVRDIGWAFDIGTRIKMFSADERKVRMWVCHPDGNESALVTFPYQADDIKRKAKNYTNEFISHYSPLKPTKNINISRLLVHSHEHSGITHKPALIGWMVESLLQQRGIPYLVDNQTLEKKYYYNPSDKKIRTLKESEIFGKGR